ncbi:hypothetical protein SALBM135S_00030 [Streptomyces alboniger]
MEVPKPVVAVTSTVWSAPLARPGTMSLVSSVVVRATSLSPLRTVTVYFSASVAAPGSVGAFQVASRPLPPGTALTLVGAPGAAAGM